MIRPLVRAMVVAGGLLVAVGCAQTRVNELTVGEEMVVGRTTFAADVHEDAYAMFADYRVVPGDVLDVLYKVTTWVEETEFHVAIDHVMSVKFVNHPELNETQQVRPDGRISLPYLGSVRVVGKTVEELSEDLRAQYAEHIRDPDLYIVMEAFRGAINEFKRDLHTAPRGLSRLTTVRPDGYATFAMVGDVHVVGRVIPEINEELNRRYREILPGLSVDLFLEKHLGSRIYVFGEVHQPGAFQILRPTSILEALALAGSVNRSARIDSILVLRQQADRVVATRLDLRETMMPTRARRQTDDSDGMTRYPVAKGRIFYLRPDDVVFVPSRPLSTAAQISREVADVLFFRGWGFSIDLDRSRR